MSYFGNREQAKSDAKAGDMQIDDLNTTSPILKGSSEAGAAPMEGLKEFTTERTRHGWKGNQGETRREFPSEGVSTGGMQPLKK
jgi:hypothetical protein